MQVRRNPAVYAGLALVAVAAAPRCAYAEAPSWAEGLEGLRVAAGTLGELAASHPYVVTVGVAGLACVVAGTVARSRWNRGHAEVAQPRAEGESTDISSGREERPRSSATTYRPRHMSAAEWERSGVIRVRKGAWETDASQDEAEEPKAVSKGVPVTGAGEKKPYQARHFATSIEDLATNYVERVTFSQRMARRAEGVAEVLRDRLGSDMMDGLPVIERADGSVGDVGTEWWNKTVGFEAIEKNPGYVAEGLDAIPSDFTQPGVAAAWEIRDSIPAIQSVDTSRSVPASADAAERSRQIAARLPFVFEGVYPEQRTVEEVSEDPWSQALKAMDDRLGSVPEVPAAFEDAAGGEESIDDPDGMEPDTLVMAFRVPAGHPEVTDTASYVDYLIGQEFSHNESSAARRSSREYLTVLDGGATGRLGGEQEGRHFAKAAEA